MDADLTCKMKRYHEKNNKQFVQQPVLVTQVCAYRPVTCLWKQEGRADIGDVTGEEGKITQGTYTRARVEWCVEETAYKQ